MYSAYEVARQKLLDGIYHEFQSAQRDLSDHGQRHISNVMMNALQLIGDDSKAHGLTAIDLHVLAIGILFHDVGNLFGRENHHKRISEVFDWARGTSPHLRHEKHIIMKLAAAHTGRAADGTFDTLSELADNSEHIDGERVRLRTIAALLRFADELAEGPQRTSGFRLAHALYAEDNRIFHEYASITHVHIDRPNQRICLDYEIDIDHIKAPDDEHAQHVRGLLSFIYGRIIKLNQERQYTRFYADVLLPFRSVRVVLNFHSAGEVISLDHCPYILDDRIVPGEPCRTLVDLDARFELTTVLNTVLEQSRALL